MRHLGHQSSRLLLISPYDPQVGFNVGNAMGRNKLIYALADAALVVASDLNKGGTWSGAVEQLDRYKCVPVYVRNDVESLGLADLRKRGALTWPAPTDVEGLLSLLPARSTARETSAEEIPTAPVTISPTAHGVPAPEMREVLPDAAPAGQGVLFLEPGPVVIKRPKRKRG